MDEVLNFTLDDFKFPGLDGLSYTSQAAGFGTDTDTSLNFNEFAKNSAMPFVKQNAEQQIIENTVIGAIEYDVKILLGPHITLTLPSHSIENGREVLKPGRMVTIIPDFVEYGGSEEDETTESIVNAGDSSWVIEEHTDLILVWNGYSWKESNYTIRKKANAMLNSSFTGRNLKKVLYDLGDFKNLYLEHYSNVSFNQVMDAIHNRCNISGELTYCQNYEGIPGDFDGIGIGDWIDHPSINIGTKEVTNPGGSTKYTWGWVEASDTIRPSGQSALVSEETSNHDTRIRIAGFDTYFNLGGNSVNQNSHVLFEYANIPLKGLMNGTSVNNGGYPASCLNQWANVKWREALVDLKDDDSEWDVMKVDRCYNLSPSSHDGAYADYYVFLPSVAEVAGFPACAATNAWGNTFPQWPIYSLMPHLRSKKYHGGRKGWWLADPYVGNSTAFVYASNNGGFGADDASTWDGGLSFAFAIC